MVQVNVLTCESVELCSVGMVLPRCTSKLVFRSARVVRTGQRKLTTWNEHWLRILPASCKLEKHGKVGKFVWTDLQFTKRISHHLKP